MDHRRLAEKIPVPGGYKVPMEALTQHELARKSWSVPQLRQLVFLQDEYPRWRLFQEYCSEGTLRDFIKNYQQYNAKHDNEL